jgi:hypothetical protein
MQQFSEILGNSQKFLQSVQFNSINWVFINAQKLFKFSRILIFFELNAKLLSYKNTKVEFSMLLDIKGWQLTVYLDRVFKILYWLDYNGVSVYISSRKNWKLMEENKIWMQIK